MVTTAVVRLGKTALVKGALKHWPGLFPALYLLHVQIRAKSRVALVAST